MLSVVDTFAVLCVTSLAERELSLITQACALASERDPKLRLTVLREDASIAELSKAGLLVAIGTDPSAAVTIPRAQELGLPVLATDGGVARQLIQPGRSGFIAPAATVPLADAICWLAHRPPVRERLRSGGLLAAGARLAQPA